MAMDITNHPCFNDKVRHKTARIHLPVAPRCNVQCNFCDRSFDCVNESRPGVTSSVLSPQQALAYLKKRMEFTPNIAVVGIAGPGDPFANPEETMETLRLVRREYPEMLLCVATNGLNLLPYIDELAELHTSHVTITINAIDPEVGEKIYSWFRYGRKAHRGAEGARELLRNQLEAIPLLKQKGILVKINTIIIPGINDTHIPQVAQKAAELGADILNCIPMYRNPDTPFGHLETPEPASVAELRRQVAAFLPQMHHCTRCRADAVGLLGQEMTEWDMKQIQNFARQEPEVSSPPASPERPCVAVASQEGFLVNLHLGEASHFHVYRPSEEGFLAVETRPAPERGDGLDRWIKLGQTLSDCSTLLVSGAGQNPRTVLEGMDIRVVEIEGLISDALDALHQGKDLGFMKKRSASGCGSGCTGGGGGCG